ncbi:hypothetical protein AMJ82_08445 [candidate division TA06 bacterium SM23_40]|uniref:histidine kinase n=1 Tax=candidate division TA06 bacterium SM23_40 TaxID=1703774 RepID=A0A0S8G7V8_UNCT6|nr:MAG: hypothetical protein AMJ82_08445 [candidate division TA06 bacterium SM23_40]
MEQEHAGRVLLVDDDPASCESLGGILEDEGYEVSTVGDAGSAIELLHTRAFDVVLTDLKLEGTDGLGLLDHIARTDPRLRVIIVTGYASLGSAIRAVQKGAFDYLVKPVAIRDVLTAVERAVEVRRAEAREKELLGALETRNVELAEKLTDLDALHRAGAALISTLDVDRLLANVVDLAASVVSARMGSVMLLDEPGERLMIRAAVGLDDETVRETIVRPGEGIAGYVADANTPLLIEDVETDARFGRKNRPRYETRSLMSVPLRVGDRVLGVLNMSDKVSGGSFTQDDLRMLTTFAAQAAMAVERAELFAAMNRRLTELSALYQIACAIGSVDTLEKTIDIIVAGLEQIAPVEQCMWLAWDEETDRLETEFARGVSQRSLRQIEGLTLEMEDRGDLGANCWEEMGCTSNRREHCPAFRLRLGRACWLVARPRWIGAVPAEGVGCVKDCSCCEFFNRMRGGSARSPVTLKVEHLLQEAAGEDPGLRSFVAAPVVVQGRLRGIFWVGSSDPRAFSDENRQLLSIVASQAVSLYEQSSEISKARQLATMGEMVSEIAHDLRHPMTIMKNYLRLLEREWHIEGRREESLRILSDEVVRLNGLVDELLQYAKPHRYAMHRGDVRAAVEQALSLVADELEERKILVHRDFREDLHMVMMNEAQIVGVLLNIIINAIQAMPDGGELIAYAGRASADDITASRRDEAATVWTVQEGFDAATASAAPVGQRVRSEAMTGSYVRIDICDTGVGIPSKDISKIFTPFYTTKECGTGLGLAGADRVLKTHGGFARVESSVGVGTTVSVFLPVATDRG